MSALSCVLSPGSKSCATIRSAIKCAALVLSFSLGATAGAKETNPPTANLIVLNVEGSDIAWNPTKRKLYVSVPSGAKAYGSTITVVDPIAGGIEEEQQLSSAATGLAISSDSKYLYAVTGGATTIQRLLLPALTPDIQWSLGADSSGNSNLAGDIKVQPGAPHTLAVSMGEFGSGAIAIFDDATERPTIAGGEFSQLGNSLQWKGDGSELYAAYTQCSDAPFYTAVSDDALFAMPVNSQGLGMTTTYHSTFREEGCRLQSDPKTDYVYGDWGEVINAANGIPVGNIRWSRPTGTHFPGPLSVLDPALHKLYTLLQVNGPNETTAFQIQEFDQTQFQLLHTIVIPGAVGTPTNFIRWGRAGLAVVTTGIPGSPDGQLYILDGGFVNPSVIPDTTAGTTLNPVPILTAVSPLTAATGSGAVTLSLDGHDFMGQPVAFWNGKALSTTLVNATQLSVQIPASDITSARLAAITASNAPAASPVSNSLPFSVNPPPSSGNHISVYSAGGNDLVWDAKRSKIYVSEPGVQGDSGDTIATVDPLAATVKYSAFLGSDPARLSISSDGHYLYSALYGANAIQQLTLPNFKVNAKWNLGGVGSFDGPYCALDLQAAPGAPETTAVVLADLNSSPSSTAAVIYDGATPRPNQVQSNPYSSLQWADSESTIYSVDQEEPQGFTVLGVGPSGLVVDHDYQGILDSYSPSIHYDAGTGLVYSDAGQAIQPSDGTVVGNYAGSGIAVPDSSLNRLFILGQSNAQIGTPNYTIQSFDQSKFKPVGSIKIDNVVGTPTALIRWGSNGLAFTTRMGLPTDFQGIGPGQLYVISGNFVAASALGSQPSETMPQSPVQRTWTSTTRPKQQSRSFLVNHNPLTQ
jgi:hypothetical protein